MKKLPPALLLLALAAPIARAEIDLPAIAPAGFARGVVLTVDGYAKTEDRATLTNFPVLVRVSPAAIPGFDYSDCLFGDGADIRFLDAAGNLLPGEVDEWNESGESLVWVALPRMTNGTEFAMVYGAGDPGPAPAGDVWERYAVVIHGGDSIANSVAGGPAATAGSADVAAAADAGRVGGGIRKSVANAVGVNVANAASALADTGKFSVSGWFKRDGKGGNDVGTHILAASRPAWNSGSGFLWLQEKGDYIDVAAPQSHQWSSGSKLPDKEWAHAAFAYEKGVSLRSYFNGAQDQAKTTPGNLENTSGTWTFGSYANTASKDSLLGDMDELRVLDGIASGDWIRAEHDAVSDASFLSAGTVAYLQSTPPPLVGLAAPASGVLFTNATLMAKVGTLGTDATMANAASWVDLELVVSANADLSSPFLREPLDRATTAPTSMVRTLAPLATNATYYAKLLARNSFGVAGESGVVSFTTRSPGPPSGTGAFLSSGLTRLAATGTVTDFGAGAAAATIRLEASTDSFATIVATAETNAVLGQSAAFALDDLEPNTDYALRFRLVNDWGLVSYVQLPETFVTRTGLVGLYAFDRTNPFEAVIGSPAKEGTAGNKNTAITLSDTITALSMVTDPAVLGDRTGVIAVPSYSALAIPNPGLQRNWTITFWFYAPESVKYHCFFQFSAPGNNDDGSLFINNGERIGRGEYTDVDGIVGAWHQLTVSSANNTQTVWYDQTKLNQTRSWNIAGMSLLQFSLDNDGEDAPLYFDEIRLYDNTAPEDVFPNGIAAGPVLLDRWTEAPYADNWGSFTRTPDRVIESAPYRTYVFSRHGTVSFTPFKDSPESSLLLVVGGGAGGMMRGGGGGAGGVVSATGVTLGAQSYSFTVGAGGVPDIHTSWYVDKQEVDRTLHEGPTTAAACGGETTLSDVSGTVLHRAAGGGGGGNFNYLGTQIPADSYGLDGASGGGASCRSTVPGRGIDGQGHDGGEAATDGSSDNSGGGGGGAGAAGKKGTDAVAGAGGNGVTNSITGLPVVYGGGGGASSYTRVGGLAGEGGGGTGVSSTGGKLRSTEANGVDGLGGGGGGGSGQGNSPYNSTGGRGGDGTVILRVLVPEGNDAEPIVAVVADPVGYTNATVAATLVALGDGASSATVSLVVSASADLSDPIFSGTLAEDAATGSFPVPLAPLLTNTLYYARATAVNDKGETGVSALLAFRTLDPEPAAVGLTPAGVGFGTITATANLASFGAGSSDATVYLDCSLLGDFSDTVSSAGVAVSALPFTQDLTTTGLVPGSNYFYRVRAVNTWGVEGVSATFSAVTEAAPVRLSEMSATPAADGTETISVTALAVEPGTTYTLSISIDGNTVQTWTGQTAPDTFSASYAGSGAHTALARVTCAYGGRTYSDTRSIDFSVGAMRVIVTDYANHVSAATAIRVHAGDTIILPQLRSGWRYRVLNDRFLSIDGLEITALEPAVAGIEVYNGDTLMGTMAVLVLPEAIEGGDVYVYDETVSTGDRIWDAAAAWDKIGSATDSEWPCNPNDIAVIPFHATEGTAYLRHKTDLSLGGILFGSFRDVTVGCTLERHGTVGAKTMTFSRTDDEPAFVKVTPNTYSERKNTLCFGGNPITLDCASSVETDACSSPTNSALHQGFVTYSACTVHIPEGRFWAVDGLPGYYINMGPTIWPPSLTGEGVFWKRGMGGLQFGNQPNFHGTLVDSSHGHLGGFNRAGPIFWHDGAGGTNVSVALAGWVAPRLGNPSVSASGYGWFRTGWDPGHGSDGPHPDVPWNPRKTMTLRGGVYHAMSTENSGWGVGVRNSRLYEELAVCAGFSHIQASIGDYRNNNNGHPINYIEYGTLSHEDKGTIAIMDRSRLRVSATATETNTMIVLKGFSDHSVGRSGDCTVSDVYPIIPWAVAPCSTDDSNWRNTLFVSVDGGGLIVRPVWNNTALDAVASPFSNAYLWDKTIEIGSDVTVNSLFMNNSGKNKWLGERRTLTITSGGLVLHGSNTAIGQPGRADNGALVLGDADHPGYVFAKSSDATKPNQIWADVTAPGGFVASYSGALVLGGGQTNIAEELVVNAGVLSLGTADRGCALANNLPIRVCAGATLVAPRPDAVKKSALWFDGAGGQFGRVELPDGVAAQCKKAWWRNYPKTPEWQSLPRGIYGSSDSGVSGEFVRDDLFVGAGTLRVVQDDRIPPTIMILR
jgi:hypothetical protein